MRALRHAVERAVILSGGSAFEADDFPLNTERRTPEPPAAGTAFDLDTLERDAIVRALEQHNGNVSRAAQALGLTRASLYRRMQKHGL